MLTFGREIEKEQRLRKCRGGEACISKSHRGDDLVQSASFAASHRRLSSSCIRVPIAIRRQNSALRHHRGCHRHKKLNLAKGLGTWTPMNVHHSSSTFYLRLAVGVALGRGCRAKACSKLSWLHHEAHVCQVAQKSRCVPRWARHLLSVEGWLQVSWWELAPSVQRCDQPAVRQ